MCARWVYVKEHFLFPRRNVFPIYLNDMDIAEVQIVSVTLNKEGTTKKKSLKL